MRVWLTSLFILCLLTSAYAQTAEEGYKAYNAGDYEKAKAIILPLAEKGDPVAITYLAKLYFDGLGVKEDVELACDLFEKAAQLNIPEAQTYTGLCYSTPTPGRAPQARKAYFWMKKGYDSGSLEYLDVLGLNAYTVEDYELAFKLLLPFAQKGNKEAMNLIGTFYRDGYHVPQDYEKACDWFEKAANANFDYGLYHLAICFYHGEGRPQDKKTAFNYFKAASALGHKSAKKAMQEMQHFDKAD